MPGFDDRLRQHLERVAPPADPSGAFDRILERKIKRRLMRRFQAAGLVVVVIAATIGGTFALVRAFDSRDDDDRLGGISPTPGPVANGLIAFASQESGNQDIGNWDIWTADPDGTDARNITEGSTTNETSPAWSPDGMSIAFVTDRDGNPEIYVMDRTGGEQVRLTQDPGPDLAPAWSPDGSKIAFMRGDGIYVMGSDGSEPTRLTTGQEDRNPTWAPDGTRIAFARSGPQVYYGPGTPPSSANGIYVVRVDGGGVSRLTLTPQPSVPFSERLAADDWPDWSPDGKKMLFGRGGEIFVVGIDGSGLKRLTDSEEGNSPSANAAWSPDGQRIVFERAFAGEERYAVHTMNVDGSDLSWTEETALDPGALAPDWQPITADTLPTAPPSSEPTPGAPGLPARCDASQVTGNFDDDGGPDTALVAKTDCLLPPESRHENSVYTTEYALKVTWPPSVGVAPLPDCRKACRALAATDLNGDGVDEFILMVDKGASTDFFQVYELPVSEAFGRPVIVAPPGGKDFPPGETAEFALFGSVTHFTAIGCDLIKHQVIVQAAVESSDPGRYSVHETLLRLETTENPPFAEFHVVSERDYTERVDEGVGVGDHFEPGDPCWMYGS